MQKKIQEGGSSMYIVQVLATEGAAGIPSAAYKSRFSLLCNQVDFSAVLLICTH